jgi:integrase
MREKGHTFGAAYLSVRQGHLDNYIGPLFGAEDPRALGGRQIDDTLLGAPRRHGRKPLAPATKYKIMYSFALVLADLRERGIIETNPLEGIKPYSKAPIAPRGALPRDALPKLFPTTHGELVQVWSGSMWAACMLVLLETGMRPGELRALRWGELYGEERAFVVRHGIEAGTVDHVKGTKTDQVKSGGISIRTAQELTIWRAESRHSGADDFIFTLEGPPVTGAGILKAFRRGLAAVDLEAERWTPYWLRHSFITYSLDSLEDSELLMLAGHTNLTTNAIYRHPDDEIVLKRSKTAREKLDMARGK